MLDKRSKTVLYIFGATLLLILLSEVVRPRPVNWRPSYTSSEKIPFGSFILFEELPSLFGDIPIEKVERDPYEFLLDSTYVQNSAYIFLNNDLYMDVRQAEAISKYVSEGNTAFMSASSFGYILEDSLNVYTYTNYDLLEDSRTARLFNTSLESDSLPEYKRGVYLTLFDEIDTLKTTALGYFEDEEPAKESLNFIKVSHGDGQFLLHTLPEAFSNYYLLKGNEAYAAQVLSYIEAEHLYWDTHIKSGRKVVTSKMRFILTQDALKWFYYVTMVGIVLLMIFRAKREQRIIPVIKPLENTSIEFTKTVGDLYYQHKDYTNIITKKITYFMETVRSKFYINTEDLDDKFKHKLALKSGNSLEKTNALIDYIKHLKGKSVHSEADLIAFNKKTQDFKL